MDIYPLVFSTNIMKKMEIKGWNADDAYFL